MVMDMAAVIHTVKPQRAKVFGEHAQIHLLSFLKRQLSNNTARVRLHMGYISRGKSQAADQSKTRK